MHFMTALAENIVDSDSSSVMNERRQRSGVQVAARMVFTRGHRVRNVASH